MYPITTKLKAWAVAHLGCKATDDEATIRKAVNKAIKARKLNAEKLTELTGWKIGDGGKEPGTGKLLGELASIFQRLDEQSLSDETVKWAKGQIDKKRPGWGDQANDATLRTFLKQAMGEGRLSPAEFDRMQKGEVPVTEKKKSAGGTPSKKAMGVVGGKGAGGVRVKAASEQYSTKQYTGKHAKTGQPVLFQGKEVQTPSELTKAKMGVWMKYQAMKSGVMPVGVGLSDHERSLLEEMFQKDTFVAVQGNDSERVLKGLEVKALLNDSTSGGLYLNPIWFDDAIVTFPLLNGELFPFVDVKDMPRSNRIETGSLGNPTVVWGTAEGTAITPFTTTGLAAQITATTFPVQIAVEVGNDYLSDAAVDVGGFLVEVIGQRFLQELDGVIAIGDGTTQPQGLTNASGTVAVSSDNGAPGPLTVGDLESLMFGIPKQYRREEWNHCFVGNDVAYRRFCSIPVGPTDERRVTNPNMEHADYVKLHRPFRISQSFANNQVAYVALKKYRMWRRQGVETRWTREGNYLSLRNLSLLVVRARFAGKLLDGAAMAMMSDAQS